MDFLQIANARQSCRHFDDTREVERKKIDCILEAARLAPSACNSQPYQITICHGQKAKEVEKATQGMGMNRFATQAPVAIVLSEMPYSPSAALGAKVKNIDFRSIDIGIMTAYLTAEAAAQGLSTCILGWLDDAEIRKICDLNQPIRLVIVLGYAHPEDQLRPKKRKEMSALVKEI